MHDKPDPCDIVPDEAQGLLRSGHPASGLMATSWDAAASEATRAGLVRTPHDNPAGRTAGLATWEGREGSPRARPIPVVIDTDPGLGEPGSDVDDGFAIAFALRSPELDVRGLTIVNGNVDALTGLAVARRLRERLGRADLPIRLGATRPLVRDMAPVHALFAAALTGPARPRPEPGLAPEGEESAAEFLVREAARAPGELVVIAIGPMTNLALALALDPAFAANVREVVVMAGSASTYAQNITVVGDFNAYVDPEALDRLLRSGARVRMVGLDQTAQCVFTRADAEAMRRTGDLFGLWAADCSNAWIDYLGRAFPNRPEHRDGFFLHDPLVIAAVIDPGVCTWEEACVEVELVSDLARGLVVADRGLALKARGPVNAIVATATDVARFRRLFLDRISRPARTAGSTPINPGGDP